MRYATKPAVLQGVEVTAIVEQQANRWVRVISLLWLLGTRVIKVNSLLLTDSTHSKGRGVQQEWFTHSCNFLTYWLYVRLHLAVFARLVQSPVGIWRAQKGKA